MRKLPTLIATTLFFACCAAAPAPAPASNANGNNGRPTAERINALDRAAAKKNKYIDPFTLREVASDDFFRKAIAERMAKKIKPPAFHKPPRSPNKPDEDDDDHDHGQGNDDHDHGPHDDHDNGNHNGQGNHDNDEHDNGNHNGNANGHGNGNSNSNSRIPDRRYR